MLVAVNALRCAPPALRAALGVDGGSAQLSWCNYAMPGVVTSTSHVLDEITQTTQRPSTNLLSVHYSPVTVIDEIRFAMSALYGSSDVNILPR